MGGLLVDSPVASATTAGSTGPYEFENPYVSLSGRDGVISTLAFDPSGSAHYGANLLNSEGLYFQFQSNGTPTVASSSATTWTKTADTLTLTIPVAIRSEDTIEQTEVSAGSVLSENGVVVQTFTTPTGDYTLTQIGLSLFPSGAPLPTSGVEVTVLEGGPGTTQTVVFSTEVTPAEATNGVVGSGPQITTYLDVPEVRVLPGTVYSLQLASTDPYWAYRIETEPVFPGGEFYFDDGKEPLPWAETFSVTFTAAVAKPEYTAVWRMSLDGPALESSLELTAIEANTVGAPGFEFSTAWVYGGYDVDNPATAPFRRYYSSAGQYLPVQVMKRRPSMTGGVAFTNPDQRWIYFTGQQGYDLRFAWAGILLQFAMATTSMTYTFGPGASSKLAVGQTASFPFGFSVLPHTEVVPDWYPVFSSSDGLVNTYLSKFYWERAFEWIGGLGTDWLYWISLEVAWQGGPLRDMQLDRIVAVPLTPDGYVWTLNPGEGWAFPSAPYDNRHFTTNAMYILAIAQYYAWTGDQNFLEKMLPKAELAMRYYTEQLGGASGLVTIDRGFIGDTELYTHTGENGAPGTNYWDLISYGWKDAYVNLYFVGALEALAELELAAGHASKSRELTHLYQHARHTYNETFWKDISLPNGKRAGRYVQTIDQRGVTHDAGATYLNLEAMSFGIPAQEDGRRILDWLDEGHTELTTPLLQLPNNGAAVTIPAGGTAVQTFVATDTFSHVAVLVSTLGDDDAEMTVSVYSGRHPGGTPIVQRRFVGVWEEGFNTVVEVPPQPSGPYSVEISDTVGTVAWYRTATPYSDGEGYLNGKALSPAASFSIFVVSPHEPGPADIYSKWKWAPRTTTRKNDFHYVFLWNGVPLGFGVQLEDGGADLYEVGFDVMARSLYSSPDDAYSKLRAVLERFSLPDRLCGGPPLYLGENPEDELQAGAVGVDVPFPESGVAPASALHSIIGLNATPTALTIRPYLPRSIDWLEVTNVAYRGMTLSVTVFSDRPAAAPVGPGNDIYYRVVVRGLPGPPRSIRAQPGQTIVLDGVPLSPPSPPPGTGSR